MNESFTSAYKLQYVGVIELGASSDKTWQHSCRRWNLWQSNL